MHIQDGLLMVTRRHLTFTCLLGVLFASSAYGEDLVDLGGDVDTSLRDEIADRFVVFYAKDLPTGSVFAYRPEAVDVRHPPFSSFKIPNLLIALETGVAHSLDHERVWDPQRRPPEAYWPDDWRENQTLETAFRRSVPWYFQDIAKEIGGARYRDALTRFGYGNVAVPDGDDSFWLGGPLEISPREQVAFIERLLLGQLDLRPATIDAIRAVSVLSETAGYVLHGKTGSGPVVPGQFDGAFEGWLVGWVEKPDGNTVAFALYVRGPSFESINAFRYEMSAQFLRAIGALPEA